MSRRLPVGMRVAFEAKEFSSVNECRINPRVLLCEDKRVNESSSGLCGAGFEKFVHDDVFDKCHGQKRRGDEVTVDKAVRCFLLESHRLHAPHHQSWRHVVLRKPQDAICSFVSMHVVAVPERVEKACSIFR